MPLPDRRPASIRPLSIRLLGCAATFSLCLGGGLTAQAEDAPDDVKRQETVYVYGTSTGYNEDTSRGATKTDTPIIEIPQAMTVITGDLMRDQAMAGVGEALRAPRAPFCTTSPRRRTRPRRP